MATCAVLLRRPEWLRDPADLDCQAAWWLGPPALAGRTVRRPAAASRLFADAGVAVMRSRDVHIVVKAGPFGEGSGGHSHSDALSLTVSLGSRDILIDPGTFTYVADPAERNRFRGSAAHNTVAIDGRDQAIPAGPFRWNEKPALAIRKWTTSEEEDYLDATCSYAGFIHRRQVVFSKPGLIVVLDTVEGPSGDHRLEQSWHLASLSDGTRFSFSAPAKAFESWRSLALCSREPAPVLSVAVDGALPGRMAMALDLTDHPGSGELEIHAEADALAVGRTPWSADDPLVELTRRVFRS
jgi:hypothetical protein